MEIKNQDLKKMKSNNLWHTGIVVLLLPLLFLASCKKNDIPEKFNKASQTLFQYISSNKNLGLYQAALKRAGMYTAETFSNGGPFTVFAPVDSAFMNAGLTLDSINRYDPQTLASVLKYTIVYGKISSSSLIGFYAQDVSSLNATNKPNLTKNYYGIFLNGIPLVTGASTDLNDGVLHELTRVPFPPTDNLFTLISKNKNLFAPTDDAFKKFGYPDIASIQNSNPAILQSLVYNCILDGGSRFFTSGFRGGYDIRSQFLYIDIDGFTIISTGNELPTHIIGPDMLATNGILHVVDQVIAVAIIY